MADKRVNVDDDSQSPQSEGELGLLRTEKDKERATDYAIISAVKNQPLLWDSREEEYKNTERKNSIWKDIANRIGMNTGKKKEHVRLFSIYNL